MLRNKSRCEQRARAHIARGLLSIAVAAGSASPVWPQNEMPAPIGTPSGTNPAPESPPAEEAPLVVLPVGRPYGFDHSEFVDLSETYETHPLGFQNHPDEFTMLNLGLQLHEHTLRFTGDLVYYLGGIAYARYGAYDQLYNALTALGTATLVPEHVLLHASAFATPVLINQFGPVSAPGVPAARGVNTGYRDTYGYQVSPELLFRLGNFATSDAIATDSAVYFVNPSGAAAVNEIPDLGLPPTQYTAYSATESLISGPDFARLNWKLTGNGVWVYEQPGIKFREVEETADVSFAITREFALLATGGYTTFDSNQNFLRNLDGPIALGGFRYTMIPRLSASFRAGEQFNRPSYLSDIFYQITPLTTFNFSLTDSVTTPAASLLGNLGLLGVNNQGNFYNTNYGLGPNSPPAVTPVSGFNPVPLTGAAITNVISRYRYATASLIHVADRTQYRLTGYWQDYDAVVQSTDLAQQILAGGEFAVSRNINPFLTGTAIVDYTNQHIVGGDLSWATLSVTLNYQLSQAMAVYFRTSYVRQLTNSTPIAVSSGTSGFSDLAITIGVRRQF